MSETISKASVCEILADIYPTDGEKVVAVKEVDKAYEAIQQLPPADVQLDTKELVVKIKKGISATNADDVYSCGMRDGMRWCMSLVDDEEPLFENCPSVQPEPIRINLNEPIKVKLTDWGKEIYYHQYNRTNQIAGKEICKPSFPKEDENGYTEFQLWCFMELYGECMGMTLPNVIKPLEIVYER